MIRLMLGKMGSGKTACMVREIIKNDDIRTTFTNIIIKNNKNNKIKTISRDMIIKETILNYKKNGTPNKKLTLNSEYWKKTTTQHNGINVVLDEAHTLMDSRRSMSGENVIMNDFMSLLRRILGDNNSDYGELVLITQLGRRLDINARELATSIHYHIAHYKKLCDECGYATWENNEQYDRIIKCPYCNKKLKKHNHIIEKYEFNHIEKLEQWMEHGLKTYEKHYYITDIELYFKYYDTFQWENLITDI